MRNYLLNTNLLNIVCMALIVTMALMVPELAFAQANPLLDGMKGNGPITVFRVVLVAIVLIVFFGTTLKDILAGEIGGALKSGAVIAILAGIAIKAKDLISLFDAIA